MRLVLIGMELLFMLISGCGFQYQIGGDTDSSPSIGGPTYSVGGTVSGLSGAPLTITNNDTDILTVTSNGTFAFPSPVGNGATYNVKIISKPICPSQTCTLSSGSGTISSSNAAISISCVTDTKVRFYTSSWGDQKIRITDDLHSLANNATASPRVITGFSDLGEGMNLTVDQVNNRIYVIDGTTIKAINNASSASGAISPDRVITLSGSLGGIGVDPINDRLYFTDLSKIYRLNSASSANGSTTPSVGIILSSARASFFDVKSDRLFVNDSSNNIYVYDSASTLTNTSSPSRTISLSAVSSANIRSMWVDACLDRLYVANRNTSTASNNLAIFANASSLAGTVNFDTNSLARMPFTNVMNVVVDSLDNLLIWTDSATTLRIFSGISNQSGNLSTTPTKSILGTVQSGYGMAFQSY